MSQYSVWTDNQEQWDANDIDPPAWTGEAESFAEAAEIYLEHEFEDGSYAELVVRNDDNGNYYACKFNKSGWSLKIASNTTLEELCSP